ncbi:MAG: hypothetical protein Q8R13_05775, partial [bacterium]|nr:hypothetical protein [bacterium]
MVSWHKGFWAVVVLGVGIAAGTAYLLMPKTDEKPTGRDDSAVPTQLSRRLYAEGIDCAPESEASTHNSLAVNPKNPNVIYVGVEGRGVFKSIDRGATWQRITNGIAVYPDKDWPDEPCFYDIGRIVIDPADPEHLLMAITDMSSGYIDWPYAQTGGVWESFDGGTSWRQILTGELNAAGTGALAFDPTNPKVIYFGVNSDYPTFSEAPIRTTLNRKGILYKTADGGRTWEELPTGVLTGTQGVAVFIDAENPDNLWLFTQSHDHIQLGGGRYIEEPIAEQYGPMRSSDGGKTWESLAERLPPERRLIFDGDVAKHNFRRLIVRS